ncbi:hypothetical protein MTO96_011569 [Rhipicephalus appendiculatus]
MQTSNATGGQITSSVKTKAGRARRNHAAALDGDRRTSNASFLRLRENGGFVAPIHCDDPRVASAALSVAAAASLLTVPEKGPTVKPDKRQRRRGDGDCVIYQATM